MTSGKPDPKRGCARSTKEDVKEKFFPDEMLRPWEEKRITAIREDVVDPCEPQFNVALEAMVGAAQSTREIAAAALKEADEDPGSSLSSPA